MKTTTKQLADLMSVHPKTIRRRIERDLSFFESLAGASFSYAPGAELPPPVVEHFLAARSDNGGTGAGGQTLPGAGTEGQEKPNPIKPAPVPQPAPEKPKPQPAPEKPKPQKALEERNRETHELLFSNTAVLIGAASVLILIDAVSFAWIAFNTYPEFYRVAVPVFALAGMATGYSAFKSILAYKGWNGDGWMFGFGLFQCALHLCAMQALGEISFFLGKIVISVGLPLATAGLALALKTAQK